MWIILVIIYLLIGGALCFLFNMVDDEYFGSGYNDYGTIISVLTGALWPVVAPFSFAILYARKKKDNG